MSRGVSEKKRDDLISESRANINAEYVESCASKDREFNVSPVPPYLLIAITSIFLCFFLNIFRYLYFQNSFFLLDRLLFVFYFSIYLAMWIIYFISKSCYVKPENRKTKDKFLRFFQIPTLRRLLFVVSKNWTDEESSSNDRLEELAKDKARSSITATAMLTSITVIIMIQVKSFYLADVQDNRVLLSDDMSLMLLLLTFACAFSSFIMFIISADALDSIFNEYSVRENRLHRYHYRSTIYPRYFGMVFLITSICFLSAYINLLLGCLAFSLVFTIGYRHWFPPNNILVEQTEEWKKNEYKSINKYFWRRFLLFLSPIVLVYTYL